MIGSQTVPQFVPSIRGAAEAITQLKEFVGARRLAALRDPEQLICLTFPSPGGSYSLRRLSRDRAKRRPCAASRPGNNNQKNLLLLAAPGKGDMPGIGSVYDVCRAIWHIKDT